MPKVFVVGSVNQDIVIQAPRAPRPGETVLGDSLSFFPGGKGANQAVAARLLGSDVIFVGKIGEDEFGRAMSQFLGSFGLHRNLVRSKNVPTGTALVVVDANGDNSITVVPGANGELSAKDCVAIESGAREDYLILQNEIPLSSGVSLLRHARKLGMTSVFNAAPAVRRADTVSNLVDVVVVNEHEYEAFFEDALETGQRTAAHAERIAEKSGEWGVDIVLTLGAGGVAAAIRGESIWTEGLTVAAKDTTGAGDCFVGAFVAGLSQGLGARRALERANCAAAISVTRPGASMSFPSLEEVLVFEAEAARKE